MSTIELPWGAWHGDGGHALELPDGWLVDVLHPPSRPRCDPAEIARLLDEPIESPPLATLAQHRTSACIVVDDLARPTPASEILPAILERLHRAGLAREKISIVVATGSHSPPDAAGLEKKLGGDAVARYRVECHDCRADLAPTGIRYGDRELSVNRAFHAADLKIAIGSVLPHAFAGYSGGGKLIVPGLADLDAVARCHKFVQLGLRGGSDPNRNRFRTEAEELAVRLGLAFVVCVITNERREPVAVVAGDPVAAHRRACAVAAPLFRTDVRRSYDCAILNAYPKDINLIQSEGALIPLKTSENALVRDGGVFVLTTAASEGIGGHGLFGPGGVNYRAPSQKKALAGRELWLYVPQLTTLEVRQMYWEGYPVFHDASKLLRALADRFAGPASAAVFPCAAMQQAYFVSDGEHDDTR